MKLPKRNKKNTQNIHKVELGTLYDINKNIIEKNVEVLSDEQLQSKKDLIVDFINQTGNKYYMLLCNDRKDYTLFHRNETEDGLWKDSAGLTEDVIEKVLIDECLPNRGKTKSIELTEDKNAFEIWISIDGESYCYYFFPYDLGVIEC